MGRSVLLASCEHDECEERGRFSWGLYSRYSCSPQSRAGKPSSPSPHSFLDWAVAA